MMLDAPNLPKNSNGFRTTHTCELCGFEPKTKNKYREKQDHLVMKHFKERIDKIFPHCRPYLCPSNDCEFTGKDKQALLRHYTGKHGVLEVYLREALAEKGIQYQLSDSAKRKTLGHSDAAYRKSKMLRLSPPPSSSPAPATVLTSIQLSPVTSLLVIPAMSVEQLTTNQVMVADTTTAHIDSDLAEVVYTSTVTAALPSLPVTTTLPVSGRLPTIPPSLPATTRLPGAAPTTTTTRLPTFSKLLTRPMAGKCNIDQLLASFEPIDSQLVVSLGDAGAVADLPLDSPLVSSTTDTQFSLGLEDSKLVLNDHMWGSGNLPALGNTATETAQTVPNQYHESDNTYVNFGDIDFDYLYPVPPVEATPRQLSFSML